MRVTHSQWDYAGNTWATTMTITIKLVQLEARRVNLIVRDIIWSSQVLTMHAISGWCVSTNKHSLSNLGIRLRTSVPVFTWWQWSKLELEWELGGLRGLGLGEYVGLRSEQITLHVRIYMQLLMRQKRTLTILLAGWLHGALGYEQYLLHNLNHE